jgi:DNA-directed RNA polymerase specialized sigma24 family protein
MEGVTIVKISELSLLITELQSVNLKLKRMENQANLKGYTIQETADFLSMSYNSVRKLILRGKLSTKLLNEKEGTGKRIVPAWSINEYLTKNPQE